MRLLIFVILSLFISAPSFAENTIHDDQIKIWAYKAVSRLLTYRYDELESNLDQNKYLLTKNGCRTYKKILDMHGFIEDLINHEETMSVKKLWWNKAASREVDLITLRKSDKIEKLVKQNTSLDHMFWYAEIPLIITFQKGVINKDYRFIADIHIRMVKTNPPELKISEWEFIKRRGVISAKNSKKSNNRRSSTCDDVSYDDMEDYEE